MIDKEKSGAENMRRDLELFNAFEMGKIGPTLRLYSWQPKCLTLGYSQKIEREIDLPLAQKLGWDAVVRPTGGGIVFHNTAEVTYSLVIGKDDSSLPKGLVPAYKKISEAVVAGLKLIGVPAEVRQVNWPPPKTDPTLCFSYPAEYEVVALGKKIVGSAQKRGQKALLQQGSIFVRRTQDEAFALLLKPAKVTEAISVEELIGREVGFNEAASSLVYGFMRVFGVEFASAECGL